MVEMEVRKITKGVESNMVAFDFERTPITQIADYIIITASNNGTSDIHFDPREDGMMVRFRIDGDLQDYTYIPKIYERNLTTRLKLLANMNITESRLPQDGAIKGEFGGKYLDMRVACLPLNTGEKIVIRILDYSRSLQGIDNLGFNQTNLKKIKRMMGVPNGIILITGATGSGKSTTVYSILQGLNKPEINIITVEDPIEMNIEGMNQVQVNAEIGMTFAAALRSILREDPNVILIGEIRDSETAQIAVRASITGHLVLSTIHTNNSLATIERLLDMDVERYLLSTALTGIVSQRLAKQLCMQCRVERETTKYEKKVFKKFMKQDIEKLYDANPKGCEHCRKGYKGRIAIHEVLELDDVIRNAIANTKLKKEELAEMVYGDKTITMLQDALGKAISGLTSFEEVYRVIELESDPDDDTAYLTRSLDDDDEENEVKEEAQTDGLDDEIKSTNQKVNVAEPQKAGEQNQKPAAGQQPSKELPKVNAEGKQIQDIKNLMNNNVNVPTNAQKTPAQQQPTTQTSSGTLPQVTTLTPEQQKAQAQIQAQANAAKKPNPTTAALPQVTTLTPEQQKAQADAYAAMKANEEAAKKQQKQQGPVTLLTAEQAKMQAEMAKHKLQEQTAAENEKKIADVLAKPQEVKKNKLIIANPNITPTPVESAQQTQKPQKQAAPQPQQANLYQLPKSSSDQKPTPAIEPPKDEIMEQEIPELNIKIKTSNQKPLIPTIDESPLIQEENSFDEKNKVQEIDINKISKSTDLQKTAEISGNPLKPTIKEDRNKNDTVVPIIIDTFDVDADLKKTPALNGIKMDEIKPEIKPQTSLLNTPAPEITKIIDEPKIINTPSDEPKMIKEKIEENKDPKSEAEKPVLKPIENKVIIKKAITPEQKSPEKNEKKPVINADKKIENDKKTLITPATAKINSEKKSEIVKGAETPTTVKPTDKKPTTKKVTKTLVKPITVAKAKPVENKVSSPSASNEKKKETKTIKPTPIAITPSKEKEEKIEDKTFITEIKSSKVELPVVKTDKKDDKDEKKPFITEMKSSKFELPVVKNDKKDEISQDDKDEKKPFITEMKSSKFELPVVKTDKKDETPKDVKEEKKPFITEMKSSKFELPVVKNDKKDEVSKDDKDEKKPFITEMKSSKFELPAVKTNKKDETSKDDKEEKKPFITEMKSSKFELPVVKNDKKEETPKDDKDEKKPFITEINQNKKEISTAEEEQKKTKDNEELSLFKPPTVEINKEEKKNDDNKEQQPKQENAIDINDKKEEQEITEILDLDIDGELLSLGED